MVWHNRDQLEIPPINQPKMAEQKVPAELVIRIKRKADEPILESLVVHRAKRPNQTELPSLMNSMTLEEKAPSQTLVFQRVSTLPATALETDSDLIPVKRRPFKATFDDLKQKAVDHHQARNVAARYSVIHRKRATIDGKTNLIDLQQFPAGSAEAKLKRPSRPQLPPAASASADLWRTLWPISSAPPAASAAAAAVPASKPSKPSSRELLQYAYGSLPASVPAKPAPSNHAQTFDSMVQEYLASQAAVDATSHVPSAIPAPAATAPSASPAAQPVVASTSNDGVAAMDEYVYDVYHIVSPSAQSAADLPANSAAVADFSDVVHDVFAHDGDGDDWLVHEDEDAEDSEVDSEDSNRQDQDAFEYPDDDDVEQHDVDDDGDDEDEQFARAHGRRAQAFDSDQEGHDDDGDGDDDDEDDQRDLQHRMAMQLN